MRFAASGVFSLVFLFTSPAGAQESVANAIASIQKVDRLGVGSQSARDAVAKLNSAGPQALPAIAMGLKGANPLASNWLRSAFEVNFDKAIQAKQSLPTDQLLQFVKNVDEDPRARRMVFEWLSKVDSKLPDRLIPGMIQDPSPEFRRDAVARLIEEATKEKKAGNDSKAVTAYKNALAGAIHKDQVDSIVEPLEQLGESKVDIQKHFGFLPDWHVVGPFDNRDKKGYPVVYPPEKEVDLSGSYASEYAKEKVSWKKLSTKDDYGIFDIAKLMKNHKGSVMYATTEFVSDKDRTVEFRLGTPNAWKLWVDGKLVFEREEYHRSTRMDQYKMAVKLKRGANRILLKVCQNEQEQEWAQEYHYQLRVCNSTGSGILAVSTPKSEN